MGRPRKNPADSSPLVTFSLRFPAEVHASAKAAADRERHSLNDWMVLAAEEKLGLRDRASARPVPAFHMGRPVDAAENVRRREKGGKK